MWFVAVDSAAVACELGSISKMTRAGHPQYCMQVCRGDLWVHPNRCIFFLTSTTTSWHASNGSDCLPLPNGHIYQERGDGYSP